MQGAAIQNKAVLSWDYGPNPILTGEAQRQAGRGVLRARERGSHRLNRGQMRPEQREAVTDIGHTGVLWLLEVEVIGCMNHTALGSGVPEPPHPLDSCWSCKNS